MISSKCITWLAVFFTMSVAIVTVNLLSIVLFIKNRSLHRTHAMCLVINLTIADMFVGGFSHFSLFVTVTLLMRHCVISPLNPGTDINNWLSLRLVSSDLSYKHCIKFLDQMHATIRNYTALRYRLIKK